MKYACSALQRTEVRTASSTLASASGRWTLRLFRPNEEELQELSRLAQPQNGANLVALASPKFGGQSILALFDDGRIAAAMTLERELQMPIEFSDPDKAAQIIDEWALNKSPAVRGHARYNTSTDGLAITAHRYRDRLSLAMMLAGVIALADGLKQPLAVRPWTSDETFWREFGFEPLARSDIRFGDSTLYLAAVKLKLYLERTPSITIETAI